MGVFCLHEIYTKIYDFFIIYLLTSHRWTIKHCEYFARKFHFPAALVTLYNLLRQSKVKECILFHLYDEFFSLIGVKNMHHALQFYFISVFATSFYCIKALISSIQQFVYCITFSDCPTLEPG